MNNDISLLINHYAHYIAHHTGERLEASKNLVRWMLEALTGLTSSRIFFSSEPLSNEVKKKLDEWVNQYCFEHIPLQYLIGSVPFIDFSLQVAPPILIPRPETEEWVYKLCTELKAYQQASLIIADGGTGSGCIAIALARFFSNALVYALDYDQRALDLTRTNCHALNISNIIILQSNWLEALASNSCDIIISNPPYIPEYEYMHLDSRVRLWENTRALTAPDNGLADIKTIIEQARHVTKEHSLASIIPRLILEIGYNQGNLVSILMREAGFKNVTCFPDNAGNDRVVYGY